MKLNRLLGIVVLALCLLSILTYRASVKRAERFERGQSFLAQLNRDEIAEILISKGDQQAQLKRRDTEFVVVDAAGYPAENAAVGSFVNSALELSLEKEVGSGDELEAELGLTPGTAEALEVIFKDGTGKEMVRFIVGGSLEGGRGNYIRRTDIENSKIYLTSEPVYLSTSKDDFLRKELLNVPAAEVNAIRGRDFLLELEDDELQLADLSSSEQQALSQINSLRAALTYLRFDKHYLADAAEVAGLRFNTQLSFELADDSGYRLAVAARDDKSYLRIEAFHRARQITIAPDASEEEAGEKAALLERVNEVQQFNEFHGSWVYEISSTKAEKLKFRKRDLLDKAG